MRVIPTRYSGIKFRSRTEARWAVLFDALGIKWEYEPEGYHLGPVNYLPDFLLRAASLYVEVKGVAPTGGEIQKARLLAEGTGKRVLIVVGDPGQLHGHLFTPGLADPEPCLPSAFLARCRRCDKLAVTYQYGDDGDHGFGSFPLVEACRDIDRCSDKFTPFGDAIASAIAAARDHRFEDERAA